jgi:hypothetical protein
VDHEQSENGFERGSWTPPEIRDTSSTLDLGVGGVLRDPGGGRGVGRGAGFRFNAECSCWRCAVERLCREMERVEQLASGVGVEHWDAGLASRPGSFEEEVIDTAVRELEAEIEALQAQDAADARVLFRALYPEDPEGYRQRQRDGDV